MDELPPYLIAIGCLAVVMAAFHWLAVHVRRRGTAGSAVRAAMASYDEAFHPTAHQSHYEVQAQAGRRAQPSSPDKE